MNKVTSALNGTKFARPKTKINYMTDSGARVVSKFFTLINSTAAAAQRSESFALIPTVFPAVTDAGSTVLRNYQSYIFNSAVMHFTPSVGTTTAGTTYMGYYDNPEIILKCTNGTYAYADLLALAKASPVNTKGPVWMPLSLNVPMSRRHPKYQCDSQLATTREGIDLTVHGVVITATEGVPFSTAFGQYHMDYTATGYHLENNALAGV